MLQATSRGAFKIKEGEKKARTWTWGSEAKAEKRQRGTKKRLFHLNNKEASPSSKVKHHLRTPSERSHTQRTLKFHSALLRDLKSKYKDSRDEREGQIISQMVSGKKMVSGYSEKNTACRNTNKEPLGFREEDGRLYKDIHLALLVKKRTASHRHSNQISEHSTREMWRLEKNRQWVDTEKKKERGFLLIHC